MRFASIFQSILNLRVDFHFFAISGLPTSCLNRSRKLFAHFWELVFIRMQIFNANVVKNVLKKILWRKQSSHFTLLPSKLVRTAFTQKNYQLLSIHEMKLTSMFSSFWHKIQAAGYCPGIKAPCVFKAVRIFQFFILHVMKKFILKWR